MKKTKIFLAMMSTIVVLFTMGQGMKVLPETTITVESETSLKINTGNLTLKGDYSEVASFLQRGSLLLSVGGEVNVEQYLERDTWHMISSPVSDEDISAYEGLYLQQYDEPTESWSYLVEPMTIPLQAGKGYFNWNPTAVGNDPITPDFVVISGTLNSASTPVSLSYASSLGNPGWHVLGNPYPCALEWNGHTDWNLNNIGATIYIYEAAIGGGSSGNYRVYNFNNPPEAQVPEGNDGIIAATQGFWVKATASGASLTIPNTQRLHSNKSFYKNTPELANNILRLRVDDPENNFYCESIIAFQEGSTALFDSDFDAYFIEGSSEAPQLFTSLNGDDYMVNFLPTYEDYSPVPLEFYSKQENIFQISVSGIESFPPDLPIYLEDKIDNVFYDLLENPVYSFINNPMYESDRFNVHFKDPINTSDESPIHIYAFQENIYVNFPMSTVGDIYVYNMLGQLITTKESCTGHNKIPMLHNLNYVVRVISDQNTISKKVYIN